MQSLCMGVVYFCMNRTHFYLRLLLCILLAPVWVLAQEQTDRLLQAADMAVQQEDFHAALSYLDSAAVLSPGSADIPVRKAEIHTSQGELRKAIEAYNEAIEINPQSDDALFQRSVLRYEIGDHRNYSLNDINAALAVDPTNPSFYVQKAFYLRNTNNPQSGKPDLAEAIVELSKAIQLAPDSAIYYDLRGQVKYEAEQPLAAIGDFTTALDLDDQEASYFHDRGLTYLLIEDYAAAIDDLTRAIELDPLNETYIQKRGHARFNKADYNGAVDDFTLCINTIFRKISMISGRIAVDHPLNKRLQESYLFRGSALLQVDASYEACSDFKAARDLGNRRAGNYVKRYCR